MSCSSSSFTLLSGSELGEVAVIVALPKVCDLVLEIENAQTDVHLVVENLGFTRLGAGNEAGV